MRKGLVFLAIACLGLSATQAQEAAGWRLAAVQDLGPALETLAPINSSMSLSPDGRYIAWDGDNALCLYDLEAASGNCSPSPENVDVNFDRYNPPNWSPDSAYIAFTEDPFIRAEESDVWVYKVSTGEFTNLTDDGEEGGYFRLPGGGFLLDYGLTWGLTSRDLYFLRTARPSTDVQTLELYRTYPGNAGEPELVASLSDTLPAFSLYFTPDVSPDGSRMAVLVLDQNRVDARSGLWVISLEDGNARQVVPLPGLQQPGFPDWQATENFVPLGVRWIDDESLLVYVLDPTALGGATWNFQVVEAATGDVTPVIDYSRFPDDVALYQTDEDGVAPVSRFPRVAMIAPDGSALFYGQYGQGPTDVVTVAGQVLPLSGGAEPEALGTAPECKVGLAPGTPVFVRRLQEGGRTLLYNCLLTFEQG